MIRLFSRGGLLLLAMAWALLTTAQLTAAPKSANRAAQPSVLIRQQGQFINYQVWNYLLEVTSTHLSYHAQDPYGLRENFEVDLRNVSPSMSLVVAVGRSNGLRFYTRDGQDAIDYYLSPQPGLGGGDLKEHSGYLRDIGPTGTAERIFATLQQLTRAFDPPAPPSPEPAPAPAPTVEMPPTAEAAPPAESAPAVRPDASADLARLNDAVSELERVAPQETAALRERLSDLAARGPGAVATSGSELLQQIRDEIRDHDLTDEAKANTVRVTVVNGLHSTRRDVANLLVTVYFRYQGGVTSKTGVTDGAGRATVLVPDVSRRDGGEVIAEAGYISDAWRASPIYVDRGGAGVTVTYDGPNSNWIEQPDPFP